MQYGGASGTTKQAQESERLSILSSESLSVRRHETGNYRKLNKNVLFSRKETEHHGR